MDEKDLAEVLAIESAATPFPWTLKNYEDSLKVGHHSRVFTSEENEILGFVLVQYIADEAHILNICVKLSVQSKGLGREILNHVIDFARDVSTSLILLEVRRSNIHAQKLYYRAGFNEMSVRKGYYPAKNGREDAILMGLDLSLSSMFSDRS